MKGRLELVRRWSVEPKNTKNYELDNFDYKNNFFIYSSLTIFFLSTLYYYNYNNNKKK